MGYVGRVEVVPIGYPITYIEMLLSSYDVLSGSIHVVSK